MLIMIIIIINNNNNYMISTCDTCWDLLRNMKLETSQIGMHIEWNYIPGNIPWEMEKDHKLYNDITWDWEISAVSVHSITTPILQEIDFLSPQKSTKHKPQVLQEAGDFPASRCCNCFLRQSLAELLGWFSQSDFAGTPPVVLQRQNRSSKKNSKCRLVMFSQFSVSI